MQAEEVRHLAFAEGELWTLALANEYLAFFCVMLSRVEDGLRYGHLALSLWRDLGEPGHEAIAQATFAWLLSEVGDEDAVVQAQQAVARAELADDLGARAFACNALCVVLWQLQQNDLAQRAGAEAVALGRRVGDPVALGRWLINAGLPEAELADIATRAGDQAAARLHRERAITLYREAVSRCGGAGDSWAACIAMCNLVEQLIAFGAFEQADEMLVEAYALTGEATLSRRVVLLHMRGILEAARGHHAAAVPPLEEALAGSLMDREVGIAVQIAKAVSDSLAACGRYAEALDHHRQFFELYVRRSQERAQVRARTVSRQHELDALRLRAAQFERLSSEDPLTGLANRRHLDLALRELPRRAGRYALAMVDVDHFKTVNDTFSHIVGDEVLRSIGLILVEATRQTDEVGRFGGEEFLLIMPDSSDVDGLLLCERLRASIAAFDWQRIDPRLQVTVSIGFAAGNPSDDVAAVLALADRRLFAAKRTGRNRVVYEDACEAAALRLVDAVAEA